MKTLTNTLFIFVALYSATTCSMEHETSEEAQKIDYSQIDKLFASDDDENSPIVKIELHENASIPEKIAIDETNRLKKYYESQEEMNRACEKRKTEYEVYEKHLDRIKNFPALSVWGGIDYAMTLDEMKQVVQEKFQEMKDNNVIISTENFELIKDDYYTNKTSKDLTRIWGAEWLKKKINESEKLKKIYDVPDFIIVTNNPNKLKIELSFANSWCPLLGSLEDATIYFKKIIGKPVASYESNIINDIGPDSAIGYKDFTDPGNILQDSQTGKYYIVDTEAKSFYYAVPVNPKLAPFMSYAKKRFELINHQIYHLDYVIDLT